MIFCCCFLVFSKKQKQKKLFGFGCYCYFPAQAIMGHKQYRLYWCTVESFPGSGWHSGNIWHVTKFAFVCFPKCTCAVDFRPQSLDHLSRALNIWVSVNQFGTSWLSNNLPFFHSKAFVKLAEHLLCRALFKSSHRCSTGFRSDL